MGWNSLFRSLECHRYDSRSVHRGICLWPPLAGSFSCISCLCCGMCISDPTVQNALRLCRVGMEPMQHLTAMGTHVPELVAGPHVIRSSTDAAMQLNLQKLVRPAMPKAGGASLANLVNEVAPWTLPAPIKGNLNVILPWTRERIAPKPGTASSSRLPCRSAVCI